MKYVWLLLFVTQLHAQVAENKNLSKKLKIKVATIILMDGMVFTLKTDYFKVREPKFVFMPTYDKSSFPNSIKDYLSNPKFLFRKDGLSNELLELNIDNFILEAHSSRYIKEARKLNPQTCFIPILKSIKFIYRRPISAKEKNLNTLFMKP